VADAQAAIDRADLGRSESYDTTEAGSYDDDDNFTGPRPASSHDVYRPYDFYSASQLSPQLSDFGRLSRRVDGLVVDADRRAARRLQLIGSRLRR
jgi:hypothetical protein